MKRIKITYLFVILATFIGCQKIDDVVTDVPFEEKIVVRAELVRDSLFEGVSITKTLPINEDYDIEKAKLKSFSGYLLIDNTIVVPIHHDNNGVYKPLHNLIIERNRKYELIANAEGAQIYAYTVIPDSPMVSKAFVRDNAFLMADVGSNQDEVYGATWVVSETWQADDFHSIIQPSEQNNFQQVRVQTKELPTSISPSSAKIRVYAFDKQFLNYFRTKKNSQSIENSLAQGGGPVDWNVSGDNVIGIFIGYSTSGLLNTGQ